MNDEFVKYMDSFLEATKTTTADLINRGYEIAKPVVILPCRNNNSINFYFVSAVANEELKEYLEGAIKFIELSNTVKETALNLKTGEVLYKQEEHHKYDKSKVN